jgi:hypothetical protein
MPVVNRLAFSLAECTDYSQFSGKWQLVHFVNSIVDETFSKFKWKTIYKKLFFAIFLTEPLFVIGKISVAVSGGCQCCKMETRNYDSDFICLSTRGMRQTRLRAAPAI